MKASVNAIPFVDGASAIIHCNCKIMINEQLRWEIPGLETSKRSGGKAMDTCSAFEGLPGSFNHYSVVCNDVFGSDIGIYV